jgi:release factor glutamine methyltransferase
VAAAATTGSVRDALAGASEALAAAGVDTPRLDAEVLLAEATGWERARLAAEPEAGVPAGAGRRFGEIVRRRLRREPVAYILGRKGFRRIELAVDRRVLIPRPETELLVELALELRPRRVLDVGTGSGAVALAIAEELPDCEVVATDTSAAALEVARANAERLDLEDRVEFVEAMLPPVAADGSELPGSNEPPFDRLPLFDLIVANLPYVAESEWAGLEPEVTRWEPREALLAGPDGLDAIRALLSDERVRCLSRSAQSAQQRANAVAATAAPALALEIGAGQAEAVGELLFEAGFAKVDTRPDLAGIPRVVWGRR